MTLADILALLTKDGSYDPSKPIGRGWAAGTYYGNNGVSDSNNHHNNPIAVVNDPDISAFRDLAQIIDPLTKQPLYSNSDFATSGSRIPVDPAEATPLLRSANETNHPGYREAAPACRASRTMTGRTWPV